MSLIIGHIAQVKDSPRTFAGRPYGWPETVIAKYAGDEVVLTKNNKRRPNMTLYIDRDGKLHEIGAGWNKQGSNGSFIAVAFNRLGQYLNSGRPTNWILFPDDNGYYITTSSMRETEPVTNS